MPIFTSLLLLFAALALMSLALRSTGLARERRQHSLDEAKMATGALICEAAARDAFGVELDHSIESIAKLDALISEGWSAQTADPITDASGEQSFVLSSYLGDVFVRHSGARWRADDTGWSLGFPKLNLIAEPFDLIARKLSDIENVSLQHESDLLLNELNRLRNPAVSSQDSSIG